jgi:hypothetical protein
MKGHERDRWNRVFNAPISLRIHLFSFNNPEGFFVYAFAWAYGYYFNTFVVPDSIDNPERTHLKAAQSRKLPNCVFR